MNKTYYIPIDSGCLLCDKKNGCTCKDAEKIKSVCNESGEKCLGVYTERENAVRAIGRHTENISFISNHEFNIITVDGIDNYGVYR